MHAQVGKEEKWRFIDTLGITENDDEE